jgi:hypothetical protein
LAREARRCVLRKTRFEVPGRLPIFVSRRIFAASFFASGLSREGLFLRAAAGKKCGCTRFRGAFFRADKVMAGSV